jgi:predicted dehydrogenase
VDPADATAVAQQRDELVAAVRDHAGQVAYQLARLEGGDYGQADIETDRGEWTVKYEGGDLEYLRFSPSRGSDTYVISTKQPPEPEPLAAALEDYDAFVEGFNDYVASLDGVLDDVSTEFPEITTTDGVVAERDRVLGRIRDICDRIARELQRYEGGDYGTFTSRIQGTRWELKWDTDGASYLRVGGSSGLYLLSQYEPPSAADIREYAPQFAAFVDAYNDHVEELESDLGTVEL